MSPCRREAASAKCKGKVLAVFFDRPIKDKKNMPILLIKHGHSIYYYLILKLLMNFIIIKNMKEPLSKPINPQQHAVWCDHCGKLIPKLTLKGTEIQCIRCKHIQGFPVEAPRTCRRSQEPQKDYLGEPIIKRRNAVWRKKGRTSQSKQIQ